MFWWKKEKFVFKYTKLDKHKFVFLKLELKKLFFLKKCLEVLEKEIIHTTGFPRFSGCAFACAFFDVEQDVE